MPSLGSFFDAIGYVGKFVDSKNDLDECGFVIATSTYTYLMVGSLFLRSRPPLSRCPSESGVELPLSIFVRRTDLAFDFSFFRKLETPQPGLASLEHRGLLVQLLHI